jgi:hypothetical protein
MGDNFQEITPLEFYRGVFPQGELASHEERNVKGRYTGVAVELLKAGDKRGTARRYVITDELDYIPKLLKKDNFIIISPISYCGRNRESINARFLYAMAIDLDGINTTQQITDLFYQIENGILPTPTYCVASGNGLHLYYQFEKPIPCFNNVTKQLHILKSELVRHIWNKYTTDLYETPQYQSLFQGFRLVGGVTKDGGRTKAYKVGKPITIEYLNTFVWKDYQVKDITYKSELTLQQAKNKYPEWYDKRILHKQPKGVWECKKDLYNWWLERIQHEATVGHRYNCVACLAVYAKKCGVGRVELEKDAYSLLDSMEQLTTNEDNHFLKSDIMQALEFYNDNYFTFPIDSIVKMSAIPIQKNKRNGRKQTTHLKIARATLEVLNLENDKALQGRPPKGDIIAEWQRKNPNGRKADCIRETGLTKPTVYKYWINTPQTQETATTSQI